MNTISIAVILSFISISIFSFNSTSYSQSLQFCEEVSSSGAPINTSTVFNISDKGGFLKFLTTLPYRVGTPSVSYEIHKVDADGNETYDNTIYQDVDPSWMWFWKEVTFYNAARYNVYVYDGDKNFLASAQVRVQFY